MKQDPDDPAASIRAQRDFIHDMSSPLTIALGMVDSALKGAPPELAPKLEKAKNALNKMANLLRERRQELIASTEDKNEV